MAAPGDRDRQQKETDYLRLKQGIVKKWEALNAEQQSLLWEAEQHFTASTLPELASVKQILVCLEKVGILSPNSVGLISQMCELVDCVDGAQLVQAYLDKHPPRQVGLGQRREHTDSNTAGLSYGLTRHSDEQQLKYTPERASASSSKESPCDEVPVLSGSRESSYEDGWRDAQIFESSAGGRSAMLLPTPAAETEENRQRSMALWGHAAPRPAPAAVPAVCECHHASHRPLSKPPHHSRHPAISVEQALDPTLSGGGGGSRRGMEGVTPARPARRLPVHPTRRALPRAGRADGVRQRLGPGQHHGRHRL